MWKGHESVRVLEETLADRYLFPRERLRRAVVHFNAAQAFEADWPLSLRLLSQRTRAELALIDSRNPIASPHQIDRLLARLSHIAAAFMRYRPSPDFGHREGVA